MYHNLNDQLSSIDDDMIDAVLEGNETLIAELQQKRMEIEKLILGD